MKKVICISLILSSINFATSLASPFFKDLNRTNKIEQDSISNETMHEIQRVGKWTQEFPENEIQKKRNLPFESKFECKIDLKDPNCKLDLQNCIGWETEPGDFRKIVIEFKGQSYYLENYGGWIKVPQEPKQPNSNQYFLTLDIGLETPVLLLFGYSYASEPGFLSIISFDSGRPELIFNQGLWVKSIFSNKDVYSIIGKFEDQDYCLSVIDEILNFAPCK